MCNLGGVLSISGMKVQVEPYLLLMAKIRSRRRRRRLASLVSGHWTRHGGIATTPQWRTATRRRRWRSGAPISIIILIIISPLHWRRRINESTAITLIRVTIAWYRSILITSILTGASRASDHRAGGAAAGTGSRFGASATTSRCAAWSAQGVASAMSV